MGGGRSSSARWRRDRTAPRRKGFALRASRRRERKVPEPAVISNHTPDPRPSDPAPRFLAVDFFCGAGGTTRGLIDAGGFVIAGVDKEPRCRDTYVKNNPNGCLDKSSPEYLQYDIFPRTDDYPAGQQQELVETLAEKIDARRRENPGVPLLFAICAPCQPFTTLARKELSNARKERRRRDSKLLREAAGFVAEFRPDMVLSENVAGIGGIWEEFEAMLRKAGYATGTRRVCTSKFGVPQYRKRSILLAVREELARDSAFEDLIGDKLKVPDEDPQAELVSVQSVLERFPPLKAGEAHPEIANHRTRSLSDLNLRRLAAAKPGESNAYLERVVGEDLTLACHKRVNERLEVRCFTDVYTRMRPNFPSPTITTRCHSISNGRFGHYDTAQLRGISLREAAALQSFPDDYEFHPSHMIEPVARMIGNAVPPRLAQFFAEHLVGSLKTSNEGAEGR